jgi:P27 family predicted phage terminase small subunit
MSGAKRGPAPKPTNLRKLHGDRKDRINNAEPIPGKADIVPPAWLGETECGERALEIWAEIAPDLASKEVLTPWDVDQFAAYCDVTARFQELATKLGKRGTTYTINAKQGKLRHPEVGRYLEFLKASSQLGARFGLTPSDRSQISIGGGSSEHAGARRLLSG